MKFRKARKEHSKESVGTYGTSLRIKGYSWSKNQDDGAKQQFHPKAIFNGRPHLFVISRDSLHAALNALPHPDTGIVSYEAEKISGVGNMYADHRSKDREQDQGTGFWITSLMVLWYLSIWPEWLHAYLWVLRRVGSYGNTLASLLDVSPFTLIHCTCLKVSQSKKVRRT